MKYKCFRKIFCLVILCIILYGSFSRSFAENSIDNSIENNINISKNELANNTVISENTNTIQNNIQGEVKEENVIIENNVNGTKKTEKTIENNNVINDIEKDKNINKFEKKKNIYQIVNFYINYENVALDTEGNITGRDQNLFTPSLLESYVGNATSSTPSIADVTADNSYTANKKIRALEGYKKNGDVYIQKIPTDEEVFQKLKQYAQNIYIDGKAVSVEDLNSKNYDIRWYVFKIQSDGWHVDGRLIRKKAVLPKTGGIGNWYLYILGISAIVIAKNIYHKTKKEVVNERN